MNNIIKYQLKPEYIKLLSPEEIVEEFLNMNSRWFLNSSNGFFGYRQTFQQYCLHRLQHGKFGPDYNDKNLIFVEHYFEEFLNLYNPIIVDSISEKKEESNV